MNTNPVDSSKRNFFFRGAFALAAVKLFSPKTSAQAAAKYATSKSVEEEIAGLRHELTRLQDVNDILKLQARYEAIHATDENLGWMLFANRTDTSKEITAEKIIGFDNIKGGGGPPGGGPGSAPGGGPGGAQGGVPSGPPGASAGGARGGGPGGPGGNMAAIPAELQRYYNISAQGHKFTIHPTCSPCIEIAADGKTAKGTFVSLGFEGDMWCYGKYANDYIKIDGKWYIWHMKWLRCFKTPFSTSWADQTIDQIYEFSRGEKDENGNPKINKDINYDYLLAPNKEFKTITVPTPYKTWTKEDENGAWWKRKTVTP
jgi:hypothetical protein